MTKTSPLLLAVETATSVCSVALLKSGEDVVEVNRSQGRRHNENLPAMIEEVLQTANIDRHQINAIAVSIGPGSFSGLRVGLSFAKGFALSTGAAIFPINTLDGLALKMKWVIDNFARSDSINPTPSESIQSPSPISEIKICPLTIARRGESFGRLFKLLPEGIIPQGQIFIQDTEFMDDADSEILYIAGEGADALKKNLLEQSTDLEVQESKDVSQRIDISNGIVYIPQIEASAKAVAVLGMDYYHSKQGSLPVVSSLEPLYIKEFTVRKRRNIKRI